MVYHLEVVYYSSYIFLFRFGTQFPVLSYVVGIYLDQALVVGKFFCGRKLSFYHIVSYNHARIGCLRRKPFQLSQWAFRLSSLSSLSIDCKRIVNARNCSWLALVGNQISFIFAFCEFAFPSNYFCVCDWTDFFKNNRYLDWQDIWRMK